LRERKKDREEKTKRERAIEREYEREHGWGAGVCVYVGRGSHRGAALNLLQIGLSLLNFPNRFNLYT
jgi:hypothetical protein